MNKIAFIGAGAITEAIISGMIQKQFIDSEKIYVTNRSNRDRLTYLVEQYQVSTTTDQKALLTDADMILLTVKPKDVRSAIDGIKDYVRPNQLIVSVLAGVKTSEIEDLFNLKIPVVRAMPNTSASIGYSATALTQGQYATKKHIELGTLLFNTIGITVVVDEKKMDIVTGLSGSGPAYIYYLVEAMERVAEENNLDPDIASLLITQTIIGAGKMLAQSGESAKILREQVTSPGGTTEAGLKTLAQYQFQEAMMAGVNSAIKRAKELGK